MNLTTIITMGLVASMGWNVFMTWRIADLRADLIGARVKVVAAQDAAKACSAAVDELRTAAERQAKAAAAAIADAKRQAATAAVRADAERNRPQAVPGNACASAEVETREWLQRRRGAL